MRLWPVVLLAACAAPPPGHPSGTQSGAATALAAGFDPLEDSLLWRVGDHALFHVISDAAGDRSERWVRVEVIEPTPSQAVYRFKIGAERRVFNLPLLGLAVDVYSTDGQLLGAERVDVPDALLQAGFALIGESTEHAWPTPQMTFTEEAQRRMFSWLALAAYLDIIKVSDALSPLFWQVVRRPPMWSLLSGVRISLSDPGRRSTRATVPMQAPIGDRPGWNIPMALDVNGRRAVDLELQAVDALPPLLLTGGLVRLVATHPTLERVTTIELVSARRGTGQGFLREF